MSENSDSNVGHVEEDDEVFIDAIDDLDRNWISRIFFYDWISSNKVLEFYKEKNRNSPPP